MSVPKRFRPYLRQARTQGNLQYAGQQDLLNMLLSDAGTNLAHGFQQARGGAAIMRQGIQEARGSLGSNLAAAGLDPQALAGTPDGRRISETYANALNELDLRKAQAGEYAASGIRQATDAYTQDAGKIKQQLLGVIRDKGAYESGLFDQLVQGDRDARRAARAELHKEAFTGSQNALDRSTRLESSLIGQGIDPGTGKLLPSAKAKQQRKASKPTGADRAAIKEFERARPAITNLDRLGKAGKLTSDPNVNTRAAQDPKARRAVIANILLQGDQQANLPAIDPWSLSAALDMYFDGHLSPATVRKLHQAGVKVRRLPGVKTRKDVGIPSTPRQSHGGAAGP